MARRRAQFRIIKTSKQCVYINYSAEKKRIFADRWWRYVDVEKKKSTKEHDIQHTVLNIACILWVKKLRTHTHWSLGLQRYWRWQGGGGNVSGCRGGRGGRRTRFGYHIVCSTPLPPLHVFAHTTIPFLCLRALLSLARRPTNVDTNAYPNFYRVNVCWA